MAQRNKGGLAVMHRHYDKIIAVVVLIALLWSLLHLSQNSRRVQRDAENFDASLSSLTPKYPESSAVNDAPYQRAQILLVTPFQMEDATNRPFLVAQERVWCVECRSPILFTADQCPVCGRIQPQQEDPEDWDTDGDGIPDAIERQYGLNPLDPADADNDLDGDGFTNVEEHMVGTKLDVASDHPPRVDFLVVQDIVEVPFPLVLQGTFRGPDGRLRFQIKDTSLRQDFYVDVGQEIGKSGYVLVKGDVRKEMRKVPGWPEPREVEIHVVTVRRGTTEVVLEAGSPGKSSEFSITFQCLKDRTVVDYKARSGANFSFDQEEYEVVLVDRGRHSVVIRRLSDKVEITVPRQK